MPNSDSTWMHRVGESLTRNRPSQSFRSAGSGRIGFGSVSVGFGFAKVERNLAGFWPKYGQISSNLVKSNKIWPIFSYNYKYRVEILMDLAKICLSYRLKGLDLSVFGRVCDFRWGKNSSLGESGSSVSQIANPQLESMVSGAYASDLRPTVNKLWSGSFGWRWSGFERFESKLYVPKIPPP